MDYDDFREGFSFIAVCVVLLFLVCLIAAECPEWPDAKTIGAQVVRCNQLHGQVEVIRDSTYLDNSIMVETQDINAINCLTPTGRYRLFTTPKPRYLAVLFHKWRHH